VIKLVAAFRGHPHINNVLTHICRSQWSKIEQAVRVIVSPAATPADLSSLARNVLDLMWVERGDTGRILKPYLRGFLARNVPHDADRLLDWIARLSSASAMTPRYPEATPVTVVEASRDGS
jgi:hypothetical protein